MIKLKNYLFDLDGVLVNACDWHYETLNQALIQENLAPISLSAHVEKYNGLPTKVKLNMLGVEQSKHQLIIDLKAEFLQKIIDKECRIDECKIALFDYLKGKNGKIACVTNSVRHTVDTILTNMGIKKYFDLIVSNEDVSKNKPDPEPYNLTVDTLRINPQETLIVEDSIKGFMAAAASKVSLLWKVPDANYVNLCNYKSIFEG